MTPLTTMATMTRTSSPLLEECVAWLEGVADGGLLRFRVDAEPAPVSRIANGFGGIRHGAQYASFYRLCQEQLAVQVAPLRQAVAEPVIELNRDVVVLAEIVCTKPKTGKLKRPKPD